ncbi:MAG: response regulator [Chloroflexi bacterium]|nr:response regulator [Chloroflexota bacterium]
MTENTARSGTADEPRRVPHGGGELIVVAEPEELLNASLCRLLSVMGYRVLGVADAVSAVEILRHNLVDLLITAIALPVTGGISLCRELSRRPLGRFLPMLVLGEQSSSGRLAALEAGADGFLARPVDLHELLLIVRRLLDQRRTGNVLDPITRLPTGYAARMLVEEALKRPAWAVILFELRGLRAVNRQLGYAEGDRVRAAVAGLLRELLAEADDQVCLVRVSGARFLAVVTPELAAQLHQQATEGFQALVDEMTASGGPQEQGGEIEIPLRLVCIWVAGGPAAPLFPALLDELSDRAAGSEGIGQSGLPGSPPFRIAS